jgi:hypothetical protein
VIVEGPIVVTLRSPTDMIASLILMMWKSCLTRGRLAN